MVKSNSFRIRLSPQDREALVNYAKVKGFRSVSEYLRFAGMQNIPTEFREPDRLTPIQESQKDVIEIVNRLEARFEELKKLLNKILNG